MVVDDSSKCAIAAALVRLAHTEKKPEKGKKKVRRRERHKHDKAWLSVVVY